jgi:hypothetical protein
MAGTIPMTRINSMSLTINIFAMMMFSCCLGSELCNWLWPKLLQKKLDETIEFRNGVRIRSSKDKPGPSGMSRNTAFALPERWGGRNCLLPVDVKIIQEIKTATGGDSLISFSTPEYAAHASSVYESLSIVDLDFVNVWDVFQAMMDRMHGSQ